MTRQKKNMFNPNFNEQPPPPLTGFPNVPDKTLDADDDSQIIFFSSFVTLLSQQSEDPPPTKYDTFLNVEP